MYTHLDKSGKPCGILVNRGWMPEDLKQMKLDSDANVTKVKGVLYRGDSKHLESKKNSPILGDYWSV